MHESVKIEDVLQKLTQPPADPRLIDLVNEKRIEPHVLAHLLHGFIRVKHPNQFEFRFVGKGKSKSVVVLLSQTHPEDSLVIKCGAKELIGEELQKFERSSLEGEQALANGTEDRFRSPFCGHQEYSGHSAIAFQFPSGCRSVQTLRYAIRDEQFSRDEIIHAFRMFTPAFARWQKVAPSGKLSLGSFPWRDRHLKRIPQVIAAYKERHHDSVVEHLNSVFDGSHTGWRDKLQKIQCAGGISHGDLNSHNLLIGRDQNGSPNCYVIDFFSASKDRHSPAIDWAKLERDIKLRALRDICEDSASFRKSLEVLDSQLKKFPWVPVKDASIDKCSALVNEVRSQYATFFTLDKSDIPQIEYLYYLLCWTLAYCGADEFQELGEKGDTKTQNIIIESAIRIFDILDKKIRELNSSNQLVAQDVFYSKLKLLKKPAVFCAVLLVILCPLAYFIWLHRSRPPALTQIKKPPIRILVAAFEAAPGSPPIDVGGGIAKKIFQAKSPRDELQIVQTDSIIRLGHDSDEAVQRLGQEYKADAVIWGSYESTSGSATAPVDIHFTPISKLATGIRLSRTSSYLAFPRSDLLGFTTKAELGSRMSGLVMMLLGWSRAAQGDSVGAIDAYSAAANQLPTPDDMIDPGLAYQYRARERAHIFQLKEGIEDLTLAIQKGREQGHISEAIGLRAIFSSLLPKRGQAVKDCESIRNMVTTSSAAFNSCSVAFRILGDSRSSAFFANRAIQTSRYEGVEGHLYLAYLYAQLCNAAQADKEYDQASHLDPTNPEIAWSKSHFASNPSTNQAESTKPLGVLDYDLPAISYLRQGKNDLAKSELDKTMALRTSPGSWLDSAKLRAASGDFDGALVDLNHVLQAHPSDAGIFLFQARWYQALGRGQDAEKSMKQAIAANPGEAGIFLAQAQFFIAQAKTDKALHNLNKAVKLEPSYADAYRLLGDLALSQGHTDAAIAYYDKAIRLVENVNNPFYGQPVLQDACFDHELLYRHQLEIFYRNRQAAAAAFAGRYSFAAMNIDRNKKLDPTNPYTFYLSSQLAAATHQSPLALQEISHAIALNPTIPDNYMQQGDLLLNANGWKTALESYDKALRIAPAYVGYVQNKCHALKRLDAFTCYSDLIARFPARRELYLDRAVVQNIEEDAISDFSAALRLREDVGTLLNRRCLKKYFSYVRVSTARQGEQGISLQQQTDAI